MSILKNLTTQDDIGGERDSLGGGGVLASGLYPATITLAFLQQAPSEAMALVVHAKTSEGRDIRQTLWMTSGKAKGCKNYYLDRNDQKQYLPGFVLANSLALLTVGAEIGTLETEDKVVSLYQYEAKAEVPTKVPVFTDLIGQEILIGLIKQTVDKTQKNEATGEYVPTGETREENEIDKFFRASDRKTTVEIRAQSEKAEFVDAWSDKWTGKDRDRSSKEVKGKAGGAGATGSFGARAGNGNGASNGTASAFGPRAAQVTPAGAFTATAETGAADAVPPVAVAAAAGKPTSSLFQRGQ